MNTATTSVVPRRSIWTWALSMLAGAVALACSYGFGDGEPVVRGPIIRIMFLICLGLFVFSRLLMLVPPSAVLPRLRHWWVDYLLIIAAGVWWYLERDREPIILRLAAGYSIAIGLGSVALASLAVLIHGTTTRPLAPTSRNLLLGVFVLVLAGGAVLALPASWAGPYPVTWESTYSGQRWFELGWHSLDCVFTATAATTGTGLAVQDLGCQFSRTGQIVILLLMQTGGLVAIAIGASTGWRLRAMMGWNGVGDDTSARGVGKLIGFSLSAVLLIELAGAAVIFGLCSNPDGGSPPVFAERAFQSLFHAVSAFCNVGLTLTGDGFMAYRQHYGLYAGILPLMVLGSVGMPVIYEFCCRAARLRGLGMEVLSRHSTLSLLVAGLLIAGGAGLLYGIESSGQWQLRRQRADTPGRLQLNGNATLPDEVGESQPTTSRAAAERMQTMESRQRWAAALFTSVSARSTGVRSIRTDEASLAPASQVVLMVWMLIGGEAGGTAGGLRLLLLLIVLQALLVRPDDPARAPLTVGRHQALATAAATLAALVLLIAATATVLAFRETGSLPACFFEAVSASCNVGLSTGLTAHLSIQGRITIILAMLLGRVIPLALLLRCLALSPRQTA